MPQNICTECLIRIETACEIKHKCIATDKLLRQQIKDEDEEINPEFLQDRSENKLTCVAFDLKHNMKQETDELKNRDCLDGSRSKYSNDSDDDSSEGPSRRK